MTLRAVTDPLLTSKKVAITADYRYFRDPRNLTRKAQMSAGGSWNVTINSPMGAQQAKLNLATNGGSLTGTMAGPQGEIELTDGTVEGSALAWKAAMTQPMPITLEFSATVDGDAISGDVKLGAFGNATFSGNRA